MKSSLKLLCLMAAFAVGPQAVAQTAVLSHSGPGAHAAASQGLSRAEVRADLAVWNKSGVARFWNASDETPDTTAPEYRAAYAEYLRMKNGPEYQQELQRFQ